MRISQKNIARTVVASSLLLGMSFSPFAVAETPSATEDLTVQVELAPGFSLTCTSLDFGTVSLEVGLDRGGENQVTVNPGGVAGANQSSSTIIFSGQGRATHNGGGSAALCTIIGIDNLDNTIKVKANTPSTDLEFVAEGDGFNPFLPGASSLRATISGVGLDFVELCTLEPPACDTLPRSDTEPSTVRFEIGGNLIISNAEFKTEYAGIYRSSDIVITVQEEI